MNENWFTPRVEEGSEWVVPERATNIEVLRQFDGRRISAEWHRLDFVVVEIDRNGLRRKRSDAPWLGEGALVFRRTAADALSPLLADGAELLPATINGEPAVLVNVLAVEGVLDVEKSDVVRYASGRILTIRTFAFKAAPGVMGNAFKLAEVPLGPIFVSQRFVDVFLSRFSGLQFDRVA
jgi:hypothetical protein